MNYYNEIDPFCRKWLRALIRGAGNAINPWVGAKFIRDAMP